MKSFAVGKLSILCSSRTCKPNFPGRIVVPKLVTTPPRGTSPTSGAVLTLLFAEQAVGCQQENNGSPDEKGSRLCFTRPLPAVWGLAAGSRVIAALLSLFGNTPAGGALPRRFAFRVRFAIFI